MVKFYNVVVIYNSSLDESKTCQRLSTVSNHDLDIIIFDNSDKKNNNKELAECRGWSYLTKGCNIGLSKAYNCVLDYLYSQDISSEDYVIWFDDDSEVTQDYFDVLENSIKTKNAKVFVPVIQGQDGKYWSPNYSRFFRNKQLKHFDEVIPDQKFNAINSCTAVKLDIYKDYRYNEKLFLDQVDHSFFASQRNKNVKFCKLDIVIHHNFSTKSKMKNIEAVKSRYKIMIPDFLNYCCEEKARQFLGYVKVLGWGIKESLNYRDISFLFWTLGRIIIWVNDNER